MEGTKASQDAWDEACGAIDKQGLDQGSTDTAEVFVKEELAGHDM